MSVLYRRENNAWLQIKLHVDYNGGAPTTHGRAINASNTGHTAYYDSGLGRNVTDGDMTIHVSEVTLSSLVASGGSLSKHYFQGGLIIDRDNVTFTACRINGGFNGYNGTHHPFNLQWCTIDTPGAAGDDGIRFQDYTAHRCRIGGNSDGAKINGNVTITESYIRCKGQDSEDHNDGVQNVGGNGNVTVARCNIDCRPTNGVGAPNAALFAADGCNGLMTWHDNWVAGGGYVIRCYENATYDVQGNEILDASWAFGPVARAVIPASNLTWGTLRPNYIVSAGGTQLSVVAKP